MSTITVDAPFVATPKQVELAQAWYGPHNQVLASGAIRSGKTQAAARLLIEDACRFPAVYVVARQHYGELRDSTQRAILHGDGSLPPLLPMEVRDTRRGTNGYVGGDENTVYLVNGSEIRFRNLERAHTWLGATLGGIMIDQVEEMDGGPEGERLYDTILGRVSDPRGRRKLMLVANPAGTDHWLYRRFISPYRDPKTTTVHFTLWDNKEHLPSDYLELMESTKSSRPHWYRCFILGEWGVFEGAAYEDLDESVHVVPAMAIDNEWIRCEGMDHGTRNPTAWLVAASDYDGNLIVFDEYYDTGLISKHAAAIHKLRESYWWQRDGDGELVPAPCYADPSIRNRYGNSVSGREISVELEYAERGIRLSPGQNDRKEGYARILELLHPDPNAYFPDWHPLAGQKGAPRLFFTTRCENLFSQLRNAPVKAEGKDALDVVDPEWESRQGHAHAALRYLVLSRMGPSERKEPMVETYREAYYRRLRGQDAPGWDGFFEKDPFDDF